VRDRLAPGTISPKGDGPWANRNCAQEVLGRGDLKRASERPIGSVGLLGGRLTDCSKRRGWRRSRPDGHLVKQTQGTITGKGTIREQKARTATPQFVGKKVGPNQTEGKRKRFGEVFDDLETASMIGGGLQ